MMAFVSVPKDLTKVKNKIILNLTKRQLICFGLAAAVGVPFYFLTRGVIGSSNAATGMCLLMLPAFVFAMYEKDGLPLEKVLKNIIVVRFIRPSVRKYQVENMYEKKHCQNSWRTVYIRMITGWIRKMGRKFQNHCQMEKIQ